MHGLRSTTLFCHKLRELDAPPSQTLFTLPSILSVGCCLQGFKVPVSAQPPTAITPAGNSTVPSSSQDSGSSAARYTWKRTLAAIDEGVMVMAKPNTIVPLQVRVPSASARNALLH